MVLEQRSLQLLDLLIRYDLISFEEIQKRTGLTRRQIDYDLLKINDWLSECKYPKVEKLKRKGIIVPPETKQYVIKQLSEKGVEKAAAAYMFGDKERMAFIYLFLFNHQDYLSINHLISLFDIGKTTALKDMKHLNNHLKDYHVQIIYDRIRGYSLKGDERNLRYCMMGFVINILSYPNGSKLLDWYTNKNQLMLLQDVQPIVQKNSESWSINFVENRMLEFIYSFIFILSRIKNSGQIPSKGRNKSILKNTNEFHFAKSLLKSFHVQSQEEEEYLGAWILGLSVGDITKYTRDRTVILELVKGIVNRFESLSGVRFFEYEKVVTQLFMHFRPAYYRLLFRLPIVNPLLLKIQQEYKELYKLVRETLRPFSAIFKNDIPDEEVAYLIIHFASIITNMNEEFTGKKNALIVCPSGVGTSAILYKELREMFPEFEFHPPLEIEQLDSIKVKADIMFSTVPSAKLTTSRIPLIIVNPIMSSLEKFKFIQNVYTLIGKPVFNQPSIQHMMKIIDNYAEIKDRAGLETSLYELFTNNKKGPQEVKEPMLSDIISENLIQLNVEADDWQDAIRKAGQPLVDEAKVSSEYIQAMIDSASESGPYIVIAEHVALPHARPECGSKEIAISINRLKDPIHFGNEDNDPVQYIFCLSAIDNETHLTAMAELVELLERPEFFQKLDSAKESHEVYEFILAYEKGEKKI
ncbi:BglG family transcription antiterminator [Neobacillus mesonae]|uniref:BglG family transcription antiterminator n=1 Tax=Neobacillus mesonae TaxID=1193713 RepID=UPI00203BC9A9|nr:BglG family transcription antiterminator [Neobacillus mesonae]MCM3569370.1 BglG family transcription antiterminator [Neobacillus mesonae]